MPSAEANHTTRAALTRRNTVTLAKWTAAWLVTMALAVFGPRFIWDYAMVGTLSAIALNLVAGFGMIVANIRHLKGLDELQQKIQLEAMGLALGVAVVVGLAYSSLDITNVISFDAEISHLVVIVALTYLAGVLVGQRRYA
ncbi:MAG: hypothetical protein P8Y54_12155 [Xanthomonadales bacterium]